MSIQLKRMNWVQTPSAWDQMKAWRERSAYHRANFEAAAADISQRLTAAWTGQADGAAQLAAEAAASRIQKALDGKIQERVSVNKLI
jgi:hypothetical protein